jgi:polysaccharide deacetylase family protein (PEP-CTERM system associated)
MKTTSPIRHAFSVDVEDWYQGITHSSTIVSDRFVAATDKVLQALADQSTQATFFVLGLAADKAPQVVRRIAQAGHEIQSHGYGHMEVFKGTPQQFREDLRRGKALLEDLAGCEVFGYRAPSFSIDERTPWALDILAETGHRYDSSIFPIKMRRYGIDGYPPQPHVVTTSSGQRIVEAPVACVDMLARRIPCAGGGYVRLLPGWALRYAWRHLEQQGRAGILYMHPYEYDPTEIAFYRNDFSWRKRLHQGLGRKGFPRKIDMLLRSMKWTSVRNVLEPWLKELA